MEQTDFFQVGGTLERDHPSYVERPADDQLLRSIEEGELPLVLAPRQTGKSSLMVHALGELETKQIHAAIVDLQPLGNHSDLEHWFRDVVYKIERTLKLSTDTLDWWATHGRIGPTQRFMTFVEDVVLAEIDGRVVIFFDEIDSVLSLPFSDDFFTTLRALYNARASNPPLKNITYTLLGVATPSEFIKNRSRTPFNIGREVPLNDFDPQNVTPFRRILGPSANPLVDRIFYWTGGQPLMVQRMAEAIYSLSRGERTIESIDNFVHTTYLNVQIEKDAHLSFIQDYLLDEKYNSKSILDTYRAILNKFPIQHDEKAPVHRRLLLSGLVRVKNGILMSRNRIYENVFDYEWIKEVTQRIGPVMHDASSYVGIKVDRGKDKSTHIAGSQVGVVGDNARIEGGIHFHHPTSVAEEPGGSESGRETSALDPSNSAHILHLSDLHFGADRESDPADDARRWYGQLADDLTGEFSCQRLDALILSGDIGNFSTPEEYKAAEVFVELVCRKFGLKAVHVVVVPGNHDLSWSLSKKGYRLLDEEDHDAPLKDGHFIRVSNEVIRLRDEVAYPQRFQYFSKFHETVTGVPYPTDPKTQITLRHFPDLNLVIVGFNSCWEVDHHFTTRVSINPDALAHAMERLREETVFEDCLKFAVWHHPLVSQYEDRIKEHGFLQWLASSGFSVCLHGHLHKAEAGLYRYDMPQDGRKIHIVGAGTFGAPSRDWTASYPLQYNLLRLDRGLLRVETRRRIEPNGTWEPDHLWRQGRGKPNLAHYDIHLRRGSSPQPSPKSGIPEPSPDGVEKKKPPTVSEAEIRAYCAKTESLHESLPVAGFATHLKVPVDIEEIYIPLRAMLNLKGVDLECFGDSLEAEKHLARCDAGLEIRLIKAFYEADKRGKKGLVILGDPGSGKTTHMKRMLLWCLRQGPQSMGLADGMLPVFLPLRELQHTDAGLDRFIQDQLASRHLKMAPHFGRRLLERGNLLFLLDGLDEVPDLARQEVSAWIEEAFTDYPDCRFVVTCRFAGYSPSVRLNEKFLEMHVRPLSEKDAERFVRTWYAIVEKSLAKDVEQAASIAREKADHLIERLRRPDFRARRVFELTRNPLLLTNICLVHRHRGTLPQRRARLYEECIDVLLEHWRGAKKLELGVNALQGRLVLQPAALWLHGEEGRTRSTTDELAPHIEPALKEIQWAGGDARDFLKIIQNESGLLTGWGQQAYGFMHLGFQEYLAAREIRSRFQQEMNETGRSERLKELAGRFGNSWWQEVALLLLALDDPPLFVPFMREVVRRPEFAKHADLVEMCLDDAVKPSAVPFLELLEAQPGSDQELWQRQLLALRLAGRLDGDAFETIVQRLREHPFDKIRQWIRKRFEQARQDVIRPEPSGYELVLIRGGSFMMGSKENRSELPVHKVTLPDFYMGRYPVTNEEYGLFLSATGHREPDLWAYRELNQPQQPVVGVSWHDAQQYAQWAGLRLPSEAQWEYACRAGSTMQYSWGDTPDCSMANYSGHSNDECKGKNPGKTSPVGDYPPNDWGLYDMHGNVWEWCEDLWHDNYDNAPDDGSAWVDNTKNTKGSDRVLRGGSWDDPARYCRSAYRDRYDPGNRFEYFGFRLVFFPGQQKDKPSQAREAERNGG